MKTHLAKLFFVEAAHRNPAGNAAQQRLHGHSYRIEVLAAGPPDEEAGWVVDFGEIKHHFGPIYDRLDHALLNDLPGLGDTTVPGLKRWIEDHLAPMPPWLTGVRIAIVGDCCFRPQRLPADAFKELPERIRFTFEAAQSLPGLPGNHPCKAIHGHSYRMEVGVALGQMDQLEPVLEELHGQLDHRYLNDVPGFEQATCERIAMWVWDWIGAHGLDPTAVVVQETASARCTYYGE